MPDDTTPAPPPTTHADDRELGFGAVDARPDGAASGKDTASGEVESAMKSGGQSSGQDYADAPTPDNQGGDNAGQSHQGYSGGENPNSTSTKQATHDRAS